MDDSDIDGYATENRMRGLFIRGVRFGLLPSREQWRCWSLPSKLSAIGAYVGILSIVITAGTLLAERADAPVRANTAPDLSALKRVHDRVTRLFIARDYETLRAHFAREATATVGGSQIHIVELDFIEQQEHWHNRTDEYDNFCNGGVHIYPALPTTLFRCMKDSYEEFPGELDEDAFNEGMVENYLIRSLKIQDGDIYGMSTLFDYKTRFGYGVILGLKYIEEDGQWKIDRILFDS